MIMKINTNSSKFRIKEGGLVINFNKKGKTISVMIKSILTILFIYD